MKILNRTHANLRTKQTLKEFAMKTNVMSQHKMAPKPLKIFLLVAVTMLFSSMLQSQTNAATRQEAPPQQQEEENKTEKYKKDIESKPDAEKSSGDDAKGNESAKDEKTDSQETKPEAAKEADDDSQQRSNRRRGRRSRSRASSRTSPSFLDAFKPIIGPTAQATVEVRKDSKPIALGAIVSEDGYVLTKLSELQTPINCRLADGKEVSAYVYGVHPDTDLALLKVEAENLPVIPWATEDSLDIGHWLATVKDKERPLGVGVVGVKARLIKPQSGFMGVNLQASDRGVQVTNVTKDSPAEKGGLKRGDIIIKVNGDSYTDIRKLIPRVKSFPPGEEIRLTLLRDNKEIVADVILGEERSLNPLFERSNMQNTMGGNRLSKRRQNFPSAVQHDTFLKPEDCGGPVVNVDGKVVGINIARQGRVSSLMLPATLAKKIVEDLKTGQWAPAVVHKDRIDEINRTLQELSTQMALSPMNNDDLKDKIEKLSKEEKSLRDKLEETYREKLRAEWEIEQATKSYDSAEAEISRLKKELEKLVNGTK